MSPIRLLIQGDSHGNVNDIIPKIYTAGKYRIQHVLVVGDFGLWTHFADGHMFLDEVNEAARINNLSVYAIGGNHENWDHWNWICENFPTSKGFAMARSRVLLAPKTHQWKWAGKTFIGAGGAVSVDKDYRLAREQGNLPGERATGAKTMYWPNETLTDEDVWDLKAMGTADYLISHDCSNYTPWKTRLKPDHDSVMHREKMDEIIASVKPKMQFHGHMHTQYDWVNKRSHGLRETAFGDDDSEWGGTETRTIGLEAFKDFNSWGVLDVEGEQWYWPKEFYASIDERAERKANHDAERYAKSEAARKEEELAKKRAEYAAAVELLANNI